MSHLRIEPRPGQSLLLTDTGGARWGVTTVGVGGGVAMLAAAASGGITLLSAVVVLPLGFIALLAGLGALRHRDWVLFDRRAHEIAYRRGWASMFRAVETLPFDDVEAVVVDRMAEDGEVLAVHLRCTGGGLWPVAWSRDPAYVGRLVAAIQATGGWPVIRSDAGERPPRPVEPAGSR